MTENLIYLLLYLFGFLTTLLFAMGLAKLFEFWFTANIEEDNDQ